MTSLDANFVPTRSLISDMTQERQSIVTTIDDHGYDSDEVVRIIVPNSYGMSISYVSTQITVLSSVTFQTEIDTRSELPFVEPTFPPAFTSAHVVPISQLLDNIGLG